MNCMMGVSALSVLSVLSHDSRTLTDKKKKQSPWHLVRKRTIPTERPPLVDEI
jgi:hypothetical protein